MVIKLLMKSFCWVRVLVFVALVLALTGCGRKGALELPSETPTPESGEASDQKSKSAKPYKAFILDSLIQ